MPRIRFGQIHFQENSYKSNRGDTRHGSNSDDSNSETKENPPPIALSIPFFTGIRRVYGLLRLWYFVEFREMPFFQLFGEWKQDIRQANIGFRRTTK